MNLYFHSEAEDELTEAALYYAEARPSLGEAFVSAVEHACNRVAAQPLLGALIADDNIRRAQVARFPYSIIYRVLSDRVRVLAIVHHRRNPNFWHGRQ